MKRSSTREKRKTRIGARRESDLNLSMSQEQNYRKPLETIHSYVKLGWPVIPLCSPSHSNMSAKHKSGCDSPGKAPLLAGWQKRGVPTDIEIATWKRDWPWANLGLLMGEPSGLIGVDIDGAAGEQLLSKWSSGDLPDTWEFHRGDNSRRLLYRIPPGIKLKKFSQAGNGKHEELALLGTGQQTVIPPSIHASGDVYTWAPGRDPWTFGEPAMAPDWIVRRMAREAGNRTATCEASDSSALEVLAEKCGRFAKDWGIQQKAGLGYDAWFSWVALFVAAGKIEDACAFSRAAKKHDQRSEQIIRRRIEDPIEQGVAPTRCHTLGCNLEQIKNCFAKINTNEDGEITNSPAAFLKTNRLPWIDAGNKNLPEISGQAIAALDAANQKDPHLFLHAGPARLERDERGALITRELTPDRTRWEMARAAYWYAKTEDGEKPAKPPMDVVRDVLVSPLPFPVLTAITHVPTFAPDGTLEVEPGYHPASKTYYAPVDGLYIPEVPGKPTATDVERAKDLILTELLGDFPFTADADKAHAVALLLLPFCRAMITGPTPLHLIEASTQGSGKGLIADVTLGISTGGEVGIIPPPRDDEELRKAITSRLLEGRAAVLLDNITSLASPVLAAALTANIWDDRILGRNETARIPIRWMWVATGNNAVLDTDMTRRCIRIRLVPQQDKPWLREPEEFRHPELRTWAADHRGELIWAALTLIQAWVAAGRPRADITILGSYENWSKVIGGILANAGIPGFLGNILEFYETANREGAIWREFVAAWWERFKDQKVKTADLFSIAEGIEDFDLGKGTTERSQKTTFGKKLARQKDRIYNGYRIVYLGIEHQAALWRLEKIAEGGTDGRKRGEHRGEDSKECSPAGNPCGTTDSGHLEEKGGNIGEHSYPGRNFLGEKQKKGKKNIPVPKCSPSSPCSPHNLPNECYTCHGHTWWRLRDTPNAEWVCLRCHPHPFSPDEVEIFTG